MVEINIDEYLWTSLNNIGINTHFSGTEYDPPNEPNVNGGFGVTEWVSISDGVEYLENTLQGGNRDYSLQYGTVYITIYALTKVRMLEILADVDNILMNQWIDTTSGRVHFRTPRKIITGWDGLYFGKYAYEFYI